MDAKKMWIKRTLAAGAITGLLVLPLMASAQTNYGTDTSGTNGNTTIQQNTGTGTGTDAGTGSTDTAPGTSGTTVTPGVPSTGVGSAQALANVVLLVVSAATALVGGYFLTTDRKNAA